MRGIVGALAILFLVALAALALIGFGRNSDSRRMRADLTSHVDRGGIADLDRAQALARRLVVADDDDRDAASALAFVDAVLSVDYGLETEREAKVMLARKDLRAGQDDAAGKEAGRDLDRDGTASEVAASRALVLLRAGDRQGAARLAAVAVVAFPGSPHPLYALGRVRALNGEMDAAARALKAAVVGSPSFMLSRVAWSEARLDLGDAPSARTALEAVLAKTPGDLRARLLLDEAEQALEVAGTGTLQAACPAVQSAQDRWPPKAIRAGCALAYSARARRTGARTEALARAEEAASVAPPLPRLLARIAQALAQLGAVDRAAGLLDRARRLAAVESPALAWAGVAVALGRGKAPLLPGGPPPADPENHLLVVRAALAAGGVGALVSALDKVGPSALANDIDLRLLARLRDGSAVSPSMKIEDPVRAFVDGLRARLDGNLPAAIARLRYALSGHGDACRAAGEYAAMLRVQKLAVEPASWNLLRAENASCVNLR